MEKVFKVLLFSCICFFMAGCSASTQQDTIKIEQNTAKVEELSASSEELLREIHWKLIGIRGKAVIYKENEREAYLIFKLKNNHLQGFGGCNILMGAYTLGKGSGLTFSQLASTKMACSYMEDELDFLKALSQVESYAIVEGVLMLRKANGEVVSTFEAIYLP